MNNLRHRLLAACAVVAAALLGSALIADADDSWAEFSAWAAFLVALNVPLLLAPADALRNCTARLTWARRKN